MSVKISSLNTASTINSGDTIGVAGNNPFYFSDWGGGWYMQDGTWMRSYASKSLWMNAGLIGGDGGLTIGYGGASPSSGGAIIAGNVGIGNAAPFYSLDLTGQTIRTARIYSASTDTRLYFQNTTSGAPTTDAGLMTGLVANDAYFYNYQAGNSIFGTSGTERMRITSTGNVGIGTTSPTAPLDINGAVRVRGNNQIYFDTTSGTSTNYIGIINDYWLSLYCGRGNTSRIDLTNGSGILFSDNGSEMMRVASVSGNLLINTTTDAGYKLDVNGTARFTSYIAAASGIFSQGYGETLQVYQTNATNNTTAIIRQTTAGGNGNQDIGLLVDIQGAADTDRIANFRYYDGSTYTSRMAIMRGGNVGIGTTSPNNILHLYTNYAGSSNSGSAITITSDGSGGDNGWIGVNKGTGNGLTLGVENRDIIFQTDNTTAFNGTERMRITTDGNVGIGTTSPANLLNTFIANGAGAFSKGIRIGTGDGSYTSGHGGMLEFQNEDVMTAGIRGVRQSGWGSSLLFYVHNTSAGNTFGSTFVERMRITEDGNVLIGTTTDAGYKLDVNGTARVQGKSIFGNNVRIYPTSESWAEGLTFIMPTTATWGGLRWQRERVNTDGNWYIGFTALDSTDDLVFGANNGGSQVNNIIRLTKAGLVGIGTASPNAPLDVTSATSSSSGIQQWSYNSSPGSYRLQLNTIVSSGLVKYSFDMLNAGASYNNTLVLTNGLVGIGTASPNYKLDVNGDIYNTNLTFPMTGYSTANSPRITNPMSIKLYDNYFNGIAGSDYGTVLDIYGRVGHVDSQIYMDASQTLYFRIASYASGWGNWKTILDNTNVGSYAWAASGSWKPASLSSSTRLIGITSPDGGEFALAYSGGQIFPYTDGFFYQNEGAYRVIDSDSIYSVLADFTVGAYRFIADYGGNTTWNIRSNGQFIWGRAHDWTQSFRLNLDSGAADNTTWATLGQFDSNDTDGIYRGIKITKFESNITTLGDLAAAMIGVGTINPVTALDVVGGAYSNTTAKFGAAKPIYLINEDPHIGFNTYYDSGWKYGTGSSSSFAGTLGCATSTGDFTLQTSTAGGNAGNAVTHKILMTWKQSGFVGIGITSPEYLLDVDGRARFNGIIIGRGAGNISTNVGLGVNPLFSNTSGSENTAVGYLPMYSNTSGIRNTALGNNALYSNLSGSSNVAIGAGSLYSNLDGRYNSSVGYNSMQFMRGEYNSALGRDSMRGSLTAANNTGQYNTAVGYESMLVFTSGQRNTSLGYGTGGSLTTGSRNTFVGVGATQAAGGIVTTGNNNTIIGGYGGTTTLSDTVVLADGSGQVQLWATGKNVAFGTTAPTTYANYTTLHIAGQTTTTGGVLRLTTSNSSTAVNIYTNNVGAIYDTTTAHPHYFNINGNTNLIVSVDGISTADPGNGAVPWKLGDVQNEAVALVTNQYIEVEINGSYYRLALVEPA